MSNEGFSTAATPDIAQAASLADQALFERGLVRSRTQAQQLIRAGQVLLNNEKLVKVSAPVFAEDELSIHGSDSYVSRAAHKLVFALEGFEVEVQGKECLDLGTSTGGFSQVLLERGAERVLGIEVGHGQLAAELAKDDRLVLLEGFNARELSRDTVLERLGDQLFSFVPSVIVGDLSFISLRYILPPLVDFVPDAAEFVLLLKPQFEVGRTRVRGGIVTDPADRLSAIQDIVELAQQLGLSFQGILPSPIRGMNGNYEYLLHLNRLPANNQAELETEIAQIIRSESSTDKGGEKRI
ncbi:MAG: TlyA family RNA methyltransferase [Microbacteriaceae bacterium]